jgi:hypothetical protein
VEAAPAERPRLPRVFVYKLGSVMLVMYFSAYLSEPFFSSYWQAISAFDDTVVTGLVFAIPGLTALVAQFVNARQRAPELAPYAGILPAIAIGIGSLWLQAFGVPLALVLGRFAYGWALFQLMVRLDSLLFRLSSKDSYAADFSKINLFQGLGVLFASLTAGALVSRFGTRITVVVSASGFLLGAVLYCGLFRHALWPPMAALSTEKASS